jgi:hypothetical protein
MASLSNMVYGTSAPRGVAGVTTTKKESDVTAASHEVAGVKLSRRKPHKLKETEESKIRKLQRGHPHDFDVFRLSLDV